jgi:PII-like signaling protein
MLGRGKAKRLTVYLNEGSTWHGKPLYEAILEILVAKGLAGGTVVRAVAGFTRAQGIVTAAILDLSMNLPLRIEVVDTAEQIENVLPDLYLMLDKGLITVDDTDVIKYSGSRHAGPAAAPPAEIAKVTMKAKQLSIHISERDVYNNEPLYEAILKRFNMEEFAGATVYRALEGFGAHRQIHRNTFFSFHREAPIVLIMIDTEENVQRAQKILDGMLKHGAVIVTDVEATFYGPSATPKQGGAPEGRPS